MILDDFLEMHFRVEKLRRQCISAYWAKRDLDDPIAQLNPRQINHLMTIAKTQPCTLNEVMAHTGLSASAASSAVDKLVRAGFVRRETNEENRRCVNISVEPVIQEHLDTIAAQFRRELQECFQYCNARELAVIEEAAQIVCRRLSPEVEPEEKP